MRKGYFMYGLEIITYPIRHMYNSKKETKTVHIEYNKQCSTDFMDIFADKKEEKSADNMYIRGAQLNEDEGDIIELLGIKSGFNVFDFKVDDNVKSIQINTYELVDGKWDLMVGGGGQSFSDVEGRIALSYDYIANGLRTAVQSEKSGGSNSYDLAEKYDFNNLAKTESVLSSETVIEYEKEIPLVIQMFTSQNGGISFGLDSYFMPESIKGYEKVYSVTVMFSQKTVNELTDNA